MAEKLPAALVPASTLAGKAMVVAAIELGLFDLPDALADCVALGHAPRIEVKRWNM